MMIVYAGTTLMGLTGIESIWIERMSDSRFLDYIDNIVGLIDVADVDRIGPGAGMASNYTPVFDSHHPLESLCNALKGRGLSDEEVHKIASGNAERVLQRVF